MRSLILLGLATMSAAYAQPATTPPTLGPLFAESAIQRSKFDASFTVEVDYMPSVTLLRGQSSAARFDVVVCNASPGKRGWLKVDDSSFWGVLDAGLCTLFADVSNVYLAPVTGEEKWTATVFLRARR